MAWPDGDQERGTAQVLSLNTRYISRSQCFEEANTCSMRDHSTLYFSDLVARIDCRWKKTKDVES